jgi:hypothetical protein
MTSLIAVLSSGKGTWGQVNNLIKLGEWERVYLVCNEFSYENFEISSQKIIKLKIDEKNPQKSIDILSKFFKKEVKDFEVAINLVSGSGMEHMALLSAILKAGLGVRFVYAHNNDVEEMKIFEGPVSDDDDGFVF